VIAFQEFETLNDVAMDFTLEDWEQLRLGQEDLFWDTALDNYQNLFLLGECCPDSGVPLLTPGTLLIIVILIILFICLCIVWRKTTTQRIITVHQHAVNVIMLQNL
jgi:hypothetical protein